ncbi:cctN, partial [Symbiodinium natans]
MEAAFGAALSGAPSVLPIIAAAARRRSTSEALRWLRRTGAAWELESWTYAEVWRRSIDTAGALRGYGADGRAVGVAIDEGPALPLLELAILLAGGHIVPMDVCDPCGRLAVLLRDSTPVLAVAKDDPGLEALERAAAEAFAENPGAAPRLLLATAMGLGERGADEGLPYEDVFETPPAAAVSHIFFTSGSTGRPKGCVTTHGALASYCAAKNATYSVTEESV